MSFVTLAFAGQKATTMGGCESVCCVLCVEVSRVCEIYYCDGALRLLKS